MEENQGIPRAEAWKISGLEMDCPECSRTIQVLETDPDDHQIYDAENEGEYTCPDCDTLFIYYVPSR